MRTYLTFVFFDWFNRHSSSRKNSNRFYIAAYCARIMRVWRDALIRMSSVSIYNSVVIYVYRVAKRRRRENGNRVEELLLGGVVRVRVAPSHPIWPHRWAIRHDPPPKYLIYTITIACCVGFTISTETSFSLLLTSSDGNRIWNLKKWIQINFASIYGTSPEL